MTQDRQTNTQSLVVPEMANSWQLKIKKNIVPGLYYESKNLENIIKKGTKK